ncbi:MAG: hypothetical protein ACIAQF_05380 [Phycisphaerales bacterium JB065]
MPIRTIPIDPDTEIPPPALDAKGRPTWSMPLDRMVFWIVCALEIGSIVTVIAVLYATKQPGFVYAITVPALFLAPMLLLACRLTITLEADALRWVFFPFWKGSVPYDAIENAEICTFDAMGDFHGWGPKVVKGYTGAIAASGKGVLITRNDKKRQFVLSCTEPESLVLELLRRVVPDGTGEPENSI